MKKQRFNVTGMSCAACQAAIERTVGKMDGVQSAVVNLLANTLTTEYDETKVTNEAICSRIAQIGYGATPLKPKQVRRKKLLKKPRRDGAPWSGPPLFP